MRIGVGETRIKRFVRIRVDSWLKMKGACEINMVKASVVSAPVVGEAMTTGLLWTNH